MTRSPKPNSPIGPERRRYTGKPGAVARTPTLRQSLGRRGEQLAVDRLAELMYEIVARNFRCPAGEIDIVARRDGVWVFVEVRTRRGVQFGSPEESITARKRAHIIDAAQTYLQRNNIQDVDWRIDLVAVEFNSRGQLVRVEIIENAIHRQ